MTPPEEVTGGPSDDAAYVTIRPNDFVNPPYIRCPKCGEDVFGVICIAGHQYSRRCRNCLYPTHPEWYEPTRLPKLDKKVLYLDQFVISNMMFALNSATKQHGRNPNEAFFREVFARLDLLGKKQLLVCPSSDLHDSESATSSLYNALKGTYELLSYGVTWFDTETIHSWLITEAFEHWLAGHGPQKSRFGRDDFLHGDRTGWTDHFNVSSSFRWSPDAIKELREARDAVAEELRTVFEQWQRDQDKSFDFWVREETGGAGKNYLRGLFRQFSEMAKAQAEIISTQQVSLSAAAAFLPTHEAGVMMRFRDALMKKGLGEDEWLPKAWEFLQSEHFASLPFVKIGSMIWATVANRAAHAGQRRLPTRGLHNDVRFIETFLPYCDAMFLDKESHGILSDSLMRDVLSDYGTRIYSLRNKDDFLGHLDEIESSTSPEHAMLLNEVYGERYLKPYLGMYDDAARPDFELEPEAAGEGTQYSSERCMDTEISINYGDKFMLRFYGNIHSDQDKTYLGWICSTIASLKDDVLRGLLYYWGSRGPRMILSDYQYVGFVPPVLPEGFRQIDFLPPGEFQTAAIEESGHKIWINRDKIRNFSEEEFRELIAEICAGVFYSLTWRDEELPADEEWTLAVAELGRSWGFTGNLVSSINLHERGTRRY